VADIFLSYNREDQATAKAIATALQNEGFEVWWDTVLRAGQTYDEVTERQLHDASAVVVLWSSRSVRSKWVRAEATLGDRKSALIPVMIEQCDRPIMFELIQTADLTKWTGDLEDRQWKAFVEDVREHVERKRGAKAAAAAAAPVVAAAAVASVTASSDARDTIEAAFWMSIKDDNDASEFEAYLERYPDGHFAMLAKKRLAALTPKPAAPPAPAPPPLIEPAFAKPASAPAPQPAPKVDAFQKRETQARNLPPKKKSGSALPLILGGILVIAAAVGGFMFMPKDDNSAQGAQAPETRGKAVAEEVTTKTGAAADDAKAAISPTPPTPPQAPVAAVFSDCEGCPEMKRLDGGKFLMGSPDKEYGHRAWEGPQHEVTVPPFAISTHEVTFSEWDACLAAGGCNAYTPADKGWGRGARPAIMISWNDAQAYLKWLSGKTGKSYRLPTEAEWEYAARGGTTTAYWWGAKYESGRVTSGKTAETGSHEANAFGLYDMTGNAAEWVEDCYVNNFKEAPTDGSAVKQSGCQRVIRGGGWKASGADLRIANRSRLSPTTRDTAIGFRVVTQ
jgi:formylglycine-generating enzyme required for sulfatase activity